MWVYDVVWNKFKIGNYVRLKKGQNFLTGTVIKLADGQGRYLVKLDASCNDTEILSEFLAYEDELAACPKLTGGAGRS